MKYRRAVGIIFNNRHFEIFKDSEARYAILEYDDKKKQYHYPNLNDVLEIISRIIPKKGFQFMQMSPNKTTTKKYRFKNKIKVPLAVGTILLSSALLFSYVKGTINTELLDYISTEDNLSNEIDNAAQLEDVEGLYSSEISSISVNELSDSSKYYTVDESNKEITITNTVALDEILGYKFVSVEQICGRIDEKKFSDEYKAALKDFVVTMDDYYSKEIDFRIFFENMKTLNIRPFPKKNQSPDNLAYYDYFNNILYISPDLDFAKSYDLVILRHELGHVITSGYFFIDNGYHIKKTFFGKHQDGMYTNEALTVLFTTYPFLDRYDDDIKKNMGYPLAANIYKPIVEYMDNYSLADMSKTNVYYFFSKMGDKYNSFTNALAFMDKFEFQISQFYNNDFIVLKQDSYYIYETIANIYLTYAVSDDMSVDEVNQLRDEIKEDLSMGIVANFKQDFSGLDNAFDQYIENLNNKKIR